MLGQNTVGHTEINAHGQLDLCDVGASLLRKSSGKTPRERNENPPRF
jgi:hypothetical protein